jgi:hypothetical protein
MSAGSIDLINNRTILWSDIFPELGNACGLANYNIVTIYSAFASPTDISPNWIPYQNGLSLQVTMINGEISFQR